MRTSPGHWGSGKGGNLNMKIQNRGVRAGLLAISVALAVSVVPASVGAADAAEGKAILKSAILR